MSNKWQYQIRIYLGDEFAEVARRDPDNPAIKPLTDILAKHHATMKCQFDAFADYVAEAENRGAENYPLYEWTKATIENPEKKAKYIKSFTLYVGGNEVYAKEIADLLELDLKPLIGGQLITILQPTLSRPRAFASKNRRPPGANFLGDRLSPRSLMARIACARPQGDDQILHGVLQRGAHASIVGAARMIAKIINDALANGKLKSRISPIMPLAEAAAAHRLLEDSQRSLVKAERKDCFYIIDPIGMRRIPLRSSPDDDHRFPGPRL